MVVDGSKIVLMSVVFVGCCFVLSTSGRMASLDSIPRPLSSSEMTVHVTVIPLSGLAVSMKPAIDSMLWLLINMFVDFQILKDIPRMTSLAHLFQQQVVQEVSMGSDALLWMNGSNSNTYGNSINVGTDQSKLQQ